MKGLASPEKMNKQILFIGMAVMLISLASTDSHANGEFYGNVTLASDYLFRGVSQTQGEPALQGDLGWANDSGFYVGTWASNVEGFADVEWDFYAGYDIGLAPGTTLNLTAQYYTYHGREISGADYAEVYVGLTQELENMSVGGRLEFAPEYFGEDTRQVYFKLFGSIPLARAWSVEAHIGRLNFSDNALAGQPDIIDWMLGISYAHDPFTVTAAFADTNWDQCGSDCNTNALLAVGLDF